MPQEQNTLCICGKSDCIIPFGECHCGCGRKTSLATFSNSKNGNIEGIPVRFIHNHHSRHLRPAVKYEIFEGVPCVWIPLTRGCWTIVYECDYKSIEDVSWSCTRDGYACSGTHRKTILLHRFLCSAANDMEVDHINGNRLDNRRSNFRIVTGQENGMNRSIHNTNTSGFPGVSSRGTKWAARIKVDQVNIRLGSFYKFEDAVEARKAAEIKYFGEFRRSEQNRIVQKVGPKSDKDF